MRKKKYSLSLCLLCMLLLTGCTTGNPELDEALNDTLLTAMGALEDGTSADGSADTTAEAEDTTAEAEDTTAEAEDTTAEAEDTTAEAEDTTAPAIEPDAAVNDTTDITFVSHADNPYWGAEYAYLQALIEEKGCMGGAMYIELVGSDWDEDDIRECLKYDRVVEYLPVFANGAVVLGEGEQLFALLPGEGSWISIYPSEITEDAEFVDDLTAPLYEGTIGEPILLRCNYSDSYSNVYVTVQNEEAMYELRPNMSLEYAYTMVPTEGWLDIAPLDIRSLGYETLQWFQYNYGFELEEGLANGYALEYMGPEYHYNHYVLKFGMYRGMDDDSEEIDTYAEYAVDLTYTYKMNPDTGYYQVIGDGMLFDSIEQVEVYVDSLLYDFEGEDGAVG